MSSDRKTIDGAQIRKMLKARGLPGSEYKECCGGRRLFNRDYKTHLKRLGLKGVWDITERGILVDQVTIL